MKRCNICGSEVDEALTFCPVCGSSFEYNKAESEKAGDAGEIIDNSDNQSFVNVQNYENDISANNPNNADFKDDLSVSKTEVSTTKKKTMLYVFIAIIVAAILGVGGYFLYTEVISSDSKSTTLSPDEPGTDENTGKTDSTTNTKDKKNGKKVSGKTGGTSENDSLLTDEAVSEFLSEYAKALEDQDVKKSVEMTVIGALDSKQIEKYSGKGYYEALSELESGFRDVYANYEDLYGSGYKCTIEVKSISDIAEAEYEELTQTYGDVFQIDNAVKAECRTKFNKNVINKTLIVVEIDGNMYLTV